ALRSDLARWREYQVEQEKSVAGEEPTTNAPLRKLFMPDEEIRNAADPLAAILERHPPAEEPDGF
ncbi:MAG: hypothetical protein HN700_14925, partial [Verrucomicrobia bacterium]|nr:hypothetical protein [Verrucomicrobiota bacterium]